ncbi:MAG: aryl-sulfate sulfotransferase N-terminal domain-containing protein [Oscillospiraceae bacterium]|jgi:arylsulfate sulfotransferase|nr:aryl-sulfate sulfotransferase N-terminal domain-containing protein [Oscillospiraceae bacterium]
MIRLEMNKKQEIILAIIILVATLGFFVIYTGIFDPPPPPPEPPPPPPPTLLEIMTDRLEEQNSIDEELLRILHRGNFTLDNPYIKVNPYGTSPLTAIIIFNTDQPSKATISISGASEGTDVSFTFNGHNTDHIIPVYGLYAGVRNIVEITVEALNGDISSEMFMISTEHLPGELHIDNIAPKIYNNLDTITSGLFVHVENIVSQTYYNRALDPMFFFTYTYKTAFDTDGVFRWFYNEFELQGPTFYTNNGNFLITYGSFAEDNKLQLEINLLGRIVKIQQVNEEEIENDDEDNDNDEDEDENNENDEEYDDDFEPPPGSGMERLNIRALYTSSANNLGIDKPVQILAPAN